MHVLLLGTWQCRTGGSKATDIDHVESQSDYTLFALVLENIPNFSQPNIHGSGHFGVGGILGTLGNSAHSPGGKSTFNLLRIHRMHLILTYVDPLFFLHHCNLDRVLWNWQQKDFPRHLHEVGGRVETVDYSGQNVTLGFEINIGTLAGNATLDQLLNTKGDVLCYNYYTPELAAPQDG
jgi:tyrosinase